MPHIYKSKYPKIIVDKDANSVNDQLQKKMTIEEYYDILHHTHDIESLSNSSGTTIQEMYNTILETQQTLNDFRSTIEQQNDIIEQQNKIIQEQQNIVNNISEENEEVKRKVAELANEIINIPSVSDWDASAPGIQDMNGDTVAATSNNDSLGTIMGFDMQEL